MAGLLKKMVTLGSGATGDEKTGGSGLKILVAGAGIGGLTAAIALRRQGHEVKIFEQSRLARELGAAIHLAPNANGVLRRLGIYAESFGANLAEKFTEYSSSGQKIRTIPVAQNNQIWQHPWLLSHRIELHNALKLAATTADGPGIPAQLITGSRVEDIDPSTGRVTLKDGTVHEGDVVIGADGVHSVARKKIPGGDVRPFSSGKSAFRFLVSKKAAEDDPLAAQFVQEPGELIIAYGADRRIVMYPTSNNTLLNFVCIHPESESSGEAGDSWDQQGSLDLLLKVYKDFSPSFHALLKKTNEQDIKVWKLLDMAVLSSWTNGRLALLGDAAHPFLPHQGQGGGIAIEDAAALSVVLPRDTPKEEIPERLKLYEKIRKERADRVQQYSRLAGADIKDPKAIATLMYEYTNYNFGHDEFDNAAQRYREWTWDRNPKLYWRMPIAFGPMPGPRQNHLGHARDGTESTFTTASIKFKTSRTLLQNLFPRGTSFRFKSPGTIAHASFSCTTLNKMAWLSGSGYNHLGLYIHGVEYVKSNGEVLSGTYLPILFESLTDPIVSGREELGMPKLYSAIDVYRRATSHKAVTHWQGAFWGSFELEELAEVDPQSAGGSISGEADDGVMAYRYVPGVGKDIKGTPDAAYAVFDPVASQAPKPSVRKVYRAGKAGFTIDGLDWEALPTLHHVVQRLAEIPVYEIVEAKVVEGVGVPDVSGAYRIE